MTTERTAEEWGRVAVSLPGWRWMPGMLDRRSGERYEDGDGPWLINKRPDPDDPATGGCLLALLGSVDTVNRIADTLQLPQDVCAADAVMDAVMSGDMGRVSRACIAAAEAIGRWTA